MRPMPAKSLSRVSAALTLLTLLAAGLSSSAASAAPAPTHLVHRHFNVGATHSPRVERTLAGGTARAARSLGPAKGSVLGIDVASGQHAGGATIDWPKVAAAGYRFAFIKTTEGSYYANPFFSSDFAAAKAAGLMVAAYHFANPADSSGTFQADFAIDHSVINHGVINHGGLGGDGVTLPLITDLEYDPYSSDECYGLKPPQMVRWIGAFTAEVYRLTGQDPVIYTIGDWWDKCTGDSAAFTSDPLWVASPTRGPSPTMPVGWANWTYWQYTSSGKVPGINGYTDLSALSPTALEVAQPAAQSDQTGSTVLLPIKSINASAGQTLSYTATGLPAGLAIDPSSGLITGTLPSTPGASAATVTVSGTGLGPVTVGFTWNLHGPIVLATPHSRLGVVGSPWLLQIRASDGLHGCTLLFRASGLPPGLRMNPCGLITGWLTKPGSYHVAVSVTDRSRSPLAATSFGWRVDEPRAAGPTGQIANQGKCLNRHRSTVGVTACRPIASERWSVSPNGELHQGDICMAAGQAGPVELRHCRGTTFQNWQEGTDGALINLATGDCLTVRTVGSRPVAGVFACYGTRRQRWVLPPGPIISGLPGWCASAQPAAQPGVSLNRCGGRPATTWTAEPDGTLRANGRCLAISSPAVAGAPVRMERCTGLSTQRWQFFNALAGVQLVSPRPGLCLADPGDSRIAPVKLTLGYCLAADPGASWHLG
jgi:lysozyme